MSKLPILDFTDEILAKARSTNSLVIEAEPGAGKTTEVPKLMREFGRVLVVEPRRLAAKLTANYLSSGEDEKDKISYQIRFESTLNSKTEICFVTEGIFFEYAC